VGAASGGDTGQRGRAANLHGQPQPELGPARGSSADGRLERPRFTGRRTGAGVECAVRPGSVGAACGGTRARLGRALQLAHGSLRPRRTGPCLGSTGRGRSFSSTPGAASRGCAAGPHLGLAASCRSGIDIDRWPDLGQRTAAGAGPAVRSGPVVGHAWTVRSAGSHLGCSGAGSAGLGSAARALVGRTGRRAGSGSGSSSGAFRLPGLGCSQAEPHPGLGCPSRARGGAGGPSVGGARTGPLRACLAFVGSAGGVRAGGGPRPRMGRWRRGRRSGLGHPEERRACRSRRAVLVRARGSGRLRSSRAGAAAAAGFRPSADGAAPAAAA